MYIWATALSLEMSASGHPTHSCPEASVAALVPSLFVGRVLSVLGERDGARFFSRARARLLKCVFRFAQVGLRSVAVGAETFVMSLSTMCGCCRLACRGAWREERLCVREPTADSAMTLEVAAATVDVLVAVLRWWGRRRRRRDGAGDGAWGGTSVEV